MESFDFADGDETWAAVSAYLDQLADAVDLHGS
jgi:hypothetical protein